MWILWSAAWICYCFRRQHVLRFLQEAKLEALPKNGVIMGAKVCNMSENLEMTGKFNSRFKKSPSRSILCFLCHLYFHVSVMFAQFKKNKTGKIKNTLVFAAKHLFSFSSGYHRSLLSGLIFMPYFHVFSYIYVFFFVFWVTFFWKMFSTVNIVLALPLAFCSRLFLCFPSSQNRKKCEGLVLVVSL